MFEEVVTMAEDRTAVRWRIEIGQIQAARREADAYARACRGAAARVESMASRTAGRTGVVAELSK